MSRKSLPVVAIAMLLVIALATMGLAYGLWSETLTIDGTVYTGEVDVGLSLVQVDEWVTLLPGGQNIPEPDEKADAANCSAELKDTDPSDGYELLEITASGAYPSWHCSVKFDVHNLGNVPVLIHQPKQESGPTWVGLDGCYANETQLEQGEQAFCTILIHFDNDEADENTTYTFEYTILAHQWNEEP